MKEFINTRATFRSRDRKPFFHGWVLTVDDNTLAVEADGGPTVSYGDKVLVELATPILTSEFESRYKASNNHTFFFTMPSMLMVRRQIRNDVRRRDIIHTGHVLVDGESVLVRVSDISRTGLGFYSTIAYPAGSQVDLLLDHEEDSLLRELPLTVKVVHCVKSERYPGLFRIGGEISSILRPDKIRWDKWLGTTSLPTT